MKNDWKKHVIELREIAKEKGISNYRIAKETGYSPSTIKRIFDLDFCPKLQIVIDISHVLDVIKRKPKPEPPIPPKDINFL